MPLLLAVLAACASGEAPSPAAPTGAAAPAPAAPAAPAAAAVQNLDVAALKQALDGGAVKLLVDVRTPGEFAQGHVPGAKNIPLDQLESRLSELGAPGEVHVVCQSGGRSARAADTLAARGYAPVNILGGTGAWRAAGYPVETP